MIKNYFKIAIRNLLKNRLFTLVNVFGLTLGMACTILITVFILHEQSYDTFHANGDRIYRVLRVNQDEQGLRYISPTSAPYAPALAHDFPDEFESVTRVAPNDGLVRYGEKSYSEKRLYYVDENFFRFFSFSLKVGDPSLVLKNPNDVVLTEATAKKYFGDEDPIGKIIRLDNAYDLKVTGIANPVQANSHLNFDLVVNLELYKNAPWFSNWWNNFLFTYVQLKPSVTTEVFDRKSPGFMDKYFSQDFKKQGRRMDLSLQSLTSIYLNRDTEYDLIPHGNKQTLFIFACVSIMVLLIATLNFMNLSTAKSSTRVKEVGLRKVVGADRKNLIFQFLGESIILSFIALTLSLVAVEVILPYLNTFLGKSLSWTNHFWHYLVIFFMATLFIGTLAGLYPALVLSAFKPIQAIQSKLFSGPKRSALWKIAVVTQFSISIFLIIGTLTMLRQFDFIQSKNLGFDKDQILMVTLNNSDIRKNVEQFKERLSNQPGVIHVSSMSGEPGGFHDRFGFEISDRPSNESFRMRTVYTDFNYGKTFGLNFIAGRDFSKEYGTDIHGIVLNQTAVQALGWTPIEAIGKKMKINLLQGDNEKTVIGVIQDYHFTSLKEEIQPLAISVHPDNRVCAIKIKPGQLSETILQTEKIWAEIAPAYPMEYTFIDQSIELLYRDDVKQSKLLIVFSLLAITIACMGLFGLTVFSAERRTKEIGVRKILGANIFQITRLFSGEFIALIFFSSLIAIPIAYLTMGLWLENFAYRTLQTSVTYILAIMTTLFVAIVTVGFQAIKTANSNPVQTLRHS